MERRRRRGDGTGVKFDVYGRFVIEVIRQDENWMVYRVESGRRIRMQEIVIPADVPSDQVPRYLDDLWHESAASGKTIRRLE
jgi:hypothetical protein